MNIVPGSASARLTDLIDLRRKIDAEIEKERAFLARIEHLRKHAGTSIILDRDRWVERVLESVAAAFCVTFEEITGTSRQAEPTTARMISAWMLRQRGLSYPEIGRILCRDHSTVMHAVKRVNADPELREMAGGVGVEVGAA